MNNTIPLHISETIYLQDFQIGAGIKIIVYASPIDAIYAIKPNNYNRVSVVQVR